MRQCIACKVEYSPIENRSFHVLPNDVNLRNKWIEILNLPLFTRLKKSYVCSDHFSSESYFEDEEGRCRRRLKPGATPIQAFSSTCLHDVLDSTKTFHNSTLPDAAHISDSVNKNTYVNKISNEDETGTPKGKISHHYTITGVTNNEQVTTDEFVCGSQAHFNKIASIESVTFHCQPISKNKSNDNVNDGCNHKKRNLAVQTGNERKKVRFNDGLKVDCIYRTDFSSDGAWCKFLRYKRLQDAKLAAAHNKISRRKKKINRLSRVVKYLKDRY